MTQKKNKQIDTVINSSEPITYDGSDPSASLSTRLARVMSDLKMIEKRGHNDFHGYDFATNEDVSNAIRPLLAKHGVAFLPSMEEVSFDGGHVLCRFNMRFAGPTGETLESTWFGQAIDRNKKGEIGDKAIAKAATSGCKYFLLKTFCLSAGDEPEPSPGVDTDYTDNGVKELAKKVKNVPKGPDLITHDQIFTLQELVSDLGQQWPTFLEYLSTHKQGGAISSLTKKQGDGWIKRLREQATARKSNVESLKQQLLDRENGNVGESE